MANYRSFCSEKQLQMIKGVGMHSLCYSYLSKNQKFTEEQIEEMSVITSPLFPLMGFRETDIDSMEAAIRIIRIGQNDCESQKKEIQQILKESGEKGKLSDSYRNFLFRLKEMIRLDKIPMQGINDRLDWSNILRYQNISPEFQRKWRGCIGGKDATARQIKSLRTSSIIQGRPNRAKNKSRR